MVAYWNVWADRQHTRSSLISSISIRRPNESRIHSSDHVSYVLPAASRSKPGVRLQQPSDHMIIDSDAASQQETVMTHSEEPRQIQRVQGSNDLNAAIQEYSEDVDMDYNEGQSQLILPPNSFSPPSHHHHTSLPFMATQRPTGQQGHVLASGVAESSSHPISYLPQQSQNQMYTASVNTTGPATQTHGTFPTSYFTYAPINQAGPKKFKRKCQVCGEFDCPGSQKRSNCRTKQ